MGRSLKRVRRASVGAGIANAIKPVARELWRRGVKKVVEKIVRPQMQERKERKRSSSITRRRRGIPGAVRQKYIRKGRKVKKMNPYKVMIKVEKGLAGYGWNATYSGGTTHPCYQVLRVTCMGLVRFLMMKAKIDFGHFQDFITAPLVGGSAFDVRIWFREETPVTGNLTSVGLTSNGKTFLQLADDLAGLLVAQLSTTGSKRLIGFGLTQQTTAVPTLASQYYLVEDIYVEIKGESSVQLQNRTPAEGAGGVTPDGIYQSDNIYANPLRGKYYTFSSARPIIRDPENAVAAALSTLPYESTYGYIARSDRTGSGGAATSDFSAPVENALKKPPPGAMFSNCSHTRYMGVKPGEIVKAKIQHTVKLRLSTLMSKFASKFEAATVKTLAGLAAQLDPFDWYMGKSHIYGLEKTCDTTTATADEVFVGIEHNLFMSCIVTHKPKIGSVPLVSF